MVVSFIDNKFTLKVTGALISEIEDEAIFGTDFSMIDITFRQRVTITRSFYPSINYSLLLPNIGGTLGLWLGVGVVQLYSHTIDILAFLIMCFKKNRE